MTLPLSDPAKTPEINALFIEDDHKFSTTLIQHVGKQGSARFIPAHAGSLRTAIEQLQSNIYQVILLDLSLADGSVMSALAELSSFVPDTPVVVMADHNDRNLALELLRQGAQDFLVKEGLEAEFLERALLFAIERNRLHLALKQQSLVDELTGLLNRRGFLSLAQGQIKIAERENWGLLLLFADLDRLKRINDRLGHLEGDRALKTIAEVFTRTFRASDLIARLGGDEFVVLAFQAPAESVKGITTRLHENLDWIITQNPRLPLSLSCGVALSRPGIKVNLEDLIARADADLYREKRRKRSKQTSQK